MYYIFVYFDFSSTYNLRANIAIAAASKTSPREVLPATETNGLVPICFTTERPETELAWTVTALLGSQECPHQCKKYTYDINVLDLFNTSQAPPAYLDQVTVRVLANITGKQFSTRRAVMPGVVADHGSQHAAAAAPTHLHVEPAFIAANDVDVVVASLTRRVRLRGWIYIDMTSSNTKHRLHMPQTINEDGEQVTTVYMDALRQLMNIFNYAQSDPTPSIGFFGHMVANSSKSFVETPECVHEAAMEQYCGYAWFRQKYMEFLATFSEVRFPVKRFDQQVRNMHGGTFLSRMIDHMIQQSAAKNPTQDAREHHVAFVLTDGGDTMTASLAKSLAAVPADTEDRIYSVVFCIVKDVKDDTHVLNTEKVVAKYSTNTIWISFDQHNAVDRAVAFLSKRSITPAAPLVDAPPPPLPTARATTLPIAVPIAVPVAVPVAVPIATVVPPQPRRRKLLF